MSNINKNDFFFFFAPQPQSCLPKGGDHHLWSGTVLLKDSQHSQWKILNLLTAACQMCQTHHLSMQRRHSTKNAWRYPLKRHTFSGSKWEVGPVRHHMGRKQHQARFSFQTPQAATSWWSVPVTPRWNQWQPTGYLVPVSAALLTTQEHGWVGHCALVASGKSGAPSFAFI